MEAVIAMIVTVLEEVLSLAGSASSGQVQNIINIIEKVLPMVATWGEDLVQPLTNIISELSANNAVTPAQLQALMAQSAQIDADLDAAATADGLSGVPAGDNNVAMGATGASGATGV